MRKGHLWLDELLDYWRTHRLPVLLEWPLSFVVALGCLVYKFYAYLRHQKNNQIPPLVMEAKPLPVCDADELHQQFLQLFRDPSSTTPNFVRDRLRSDRNLRQTAQRFLRCPEVARNYTVLYETLHALYPSLLEFPPLEDGDQEYDISVVIPAYREQGAQLQRILQQAEKYCQEPSRVEIIIVLAGHCSGMHLVTHPNWKFGKVRLLETHIGGRGPTLNAGAKEAKGRILTFLHSDTLLPSDWDAQIKSVWPSGDPGNKHACVFRIGHDTEGASPFPWGIFSVQLLANFRARYFRLPYGDHVISMPKLYFDYVGGYPDQPIMEDYELMQLLRSRKTELVILKGRVKCSVRRWQSYGVPYTTLVNSLLVHWYEYEGWTPQDVFDYYYNRSQASSRKSD